MQKFDAERKRVVRAAVAASAASAFAAGATVVPVASAGGTASLQDPLQALQDGEHHAQEYEPTIDDEAVEDASHPRAPGPPFGARQNQPLVY